MDNRRGKRVPLDQIIFAVPAALYILTPLLDMFIFYYKMITRAEEFEAFAVIPYLPRVIAGLMGVALIVRLIGFKDRNLVRKALHRTNTFQTPLILFMLYLGLVIISIGANGFTYYSVYGHPYTKMGMWTYISNVVLFLFISSLVYDERVKGFLVKSCCVIASLYALFGIFMLNLLAEEGKLSVTFYNSNHYGYYLAVSIPLTASLIVDSIDKLSKGQKTGVDIGIYCVLMAVQCFALGYNDTLGAWIAVMLSLVFLFVAYRMKDGRFSWAVLAPLGIFIGMTILSGFLTTSVFTSLNQTIEDIDAIAQGAAQAEQAGNGRWIVWKLTVKYILKYPLFGNGIEGLLNTITREGSPTGSPHNEYLEYMAFFGIPAGLAYIAACLSVFIHAIKHKKELNAATLACLTGAFGYLVSAFFGVCFYYTATYPFIFLGLALNFAEKDRPALPSPAAEISIDQREETEEVVKEGAAEETEETEETEEKSAL